MGISASGIFVEVKVEKIIIGNYEYKAYFLKVNLRIFASKSCHLKAA